jgi:hypothetical protein
MQHPDEGTIHTWLDGALPDEEARSMETHVASCAPCAALVAEARGLSARASRILGALDEVPGSVVPTHSRSRRTVQTPWWRRPAVAAAAAMVIVATGTMMAVTRDWGSHSSPRIEALSEMMLPPAEAPAAVSVDTAAPGAAAGRSPVPASPAPESGERALKAETAELESAPVTTGAVVRVQEDAVESRPVADPGSRAEASRMADPGAAAPPSPAGRQRGAVVGQRMLARSGNVISSAVSVTGCYELDSRGEGDARAPRLPGVVRLTESAQVVADAAAAAQPQAQAFATQSPLVIPPAADTSQPGWTLLPDDSVSVRLAVGDQSVLVTFPSPAPNPRLGRVAATTRPGISEWTGPVVVRQVPCREP